MRLIPFIEALKRALLSRLGRAALDEIEHSELVRRAERLAEIDGLAAAAQARGDELTAQSLREYQAGPRPEAVALEALDFFDALVASDDHSEASPTAAGRDRPALPDADGAAPVPPNPRRRRRRRPQPSA